MVDWLIRLSATRASQNSKVERQRFCVHPER